MSLPDVDDEEAFLLAVEVAEAAAIASSKRPRLSTSPSRTPAASEGSYLSALKGSHSSAWKQQQETLTHKRPGGSRAPATIPAAGAEVARGACFKCGDTTHWARDCPQSVPASGGGGGGGGGISGIGGGGYVDAGGELEEKACPCGAGICLVLTSNTPRNPGRKFYRCPKRDNGGCNFFEWCDAPSPGPANARSNTVFQSNVSPVNMLCPCGAGTCLILTTKSGVNVGRQFYCCPSQGGSSCGFFKWCDDQQLKTAAPPQASSQYQTVVTSTNQNISKSSSSCFKCGQENHWAKDCPNQSSDPYSEKGGRTLTSASSSDACFIWAREPLGKAGHWSRDCPAANCGAGAVASHVKSSSALSSWNCHRY